MTPEQFIYWLQGFMEVADPKSMDEKQLQVVKDHIALVLKKETPNRSLQIPILADPKMSTGEIKIITQPAIHPYQVGAAGNVCLSCGSSQCRGTGIGCRSLTVVC